MRKSLLALIMFSLGVVREAEAQPFNPLIPPRKPEDDDPGVDIDIEDIVTRCPSCNVRHIDAGEWKNRPHRTHLCLECGTTWRPFEHHTRGV